MWTGSSDFRTLYHSQELHPCPSTSHPARRLTAESALSARSARRGPCHALRKAMRRTPGWCSARTTRMIKGAIGGSPSLRATPESDLKRQQQHFLPPSAVGRAPQDGIATIAELVAKRAPKTLMSSPSSSSAVSFSDALNRVKGAAETEKAREGDRPRADDSAAVSAAQYAGGGGSGGAVNTQVFQFGFRDHSGGAARGTSPVRCGHYRSFDAVGVLRNVWRRMHVR